MHDGRTRASRRPPLTPTRDFAVATFVVHGEQVLLLFHRKLRMWLPPGGHVEPNEIPDEAAVREVREETGVVAVLIGERALPIDVPRQLIRPEGIQLESISPEHEHVDLVYFAVPADRRLSPVVPNPESETAAWYRLDQLEDLGANDEIRTWCARAVETVARRLAAAGLNPALS